MILIIGGAYQGKLDFARERFCLAPEDIYTCDSGEIDFTRLCINALEEFCWNCPDPVGYFETHREEWKDSILICADLSCGVVPMDPAQRHWRHATGRLCQYLAARATQVSRIFCGLEQRLK